MASMASNGEALHLGALGSRGGARGRSSPPTSRAARRRAAARSSSAFRRPPGGAAHRRRRRRPERLGTHADTQVRARRLARRAAFLVDAGAAAARLSVAVKGVVDRDGVTEYLIVSTIHNRSVLDPRGGRRRRRAAALARRRRRRRHGAAAGEQPVNLRASLVGWSKNLPLAAAPRPSSANGGGGGGVRVDVSHRFSDFLKLHAKLQPQLPQLPPAFPLGRTPFVSDGVKKERAAVLALYLQAAVAPPFADATPLRRRALAFPARRKPPRALERARARAISRSRRRRGRRSRRAAAPRVAQRPHRRHADAAGGEGRCAGHQRGGAGERGGCGWRCLRCVQT